MKQKRVDWDSLALLVLTVVLAAGVRTVFGPCVHEDGTLGSCHWVGEAIGLVSLALVAQAVLALLVRRPESRAGICLAMVPTALAVFFLPMVMRSQLCMMNTMRCIALMKPACMVLSALIAVLAAFSALRSMTAQRGAERG